MTLIIYEVNILVIVLIVRLAKHVYRVCSFNNLQMADSYVKQHWQGERHSVS